MQMSECAGTRREIEPTGLGAHRLSVAFHCQLKSGVAVEIRCVEPADAVLLKNFHSRLSISSVYQRYFRALPLHHRTSEEELMRLCSVHDRQGKVLVAVLTLDNGVREVIGIGELMKQKTVGEAECSLIVSDEHQHQGLGTQLFKYALGFCREMGVRRIVSLILPENYPMKAMALRLGCHLRFTTDFLVRAEFALSDAA